MDCNKDEAHRAKDLAERKFGNKDYNGAKKFAQKAKNMFPGLDYISMFVTILDIYCRRQKTVNGEPDWHGVLEVESPADIEKLSRSYWNLSHDIEAVKNKVAGAEGAFQIVSEAWCNLSRTFWTTCSSCRSHFMFAATRVHQKLKCIMCDERFVAAPVAPGNYPWNQRSMRQFRRKRTNLVLAFSTALPSEVWGRKRVKRDNGEPSVNRLSGVDRPMVVLALEAKSEGVVWGRKRVKMDNGEPSGNRLSGVDRPKSEGGVRGRKRVKMDKGEPSVNRPSGVDRPMVVLVLGAKSEGGVWGRKRVNRPSGVDRPKAVLALGAESEGGVRGHNRVKMDNGEPSVNRPSWVDRAKAVLALGAESEGGVWGHKRVKLDNGEPSVNRPSGVDRVKAVLALGAMSEGGMGAEVWCKKTKKVKAL